MKAHDPHRRTALRALLLAIAGASAGRARTRYPGGVFDNRPTKAGESLERHDTPGFRGGAAHPDRDVAIAVQ